MHWYCNKHTYYAVPIANILRVRPFTINGLPFISHSILCISALPKISVADPHGSASFWEAGSGSGFTSKWKAGSGSRSESNWKTGSESVSKWKGVNFEGHFGALEGPNLEKVSIRIRIRIRVNDRIWIRQIGIKVKSRIRIWICSKVMRIHNTA